MPIAAVPRYLKSDDEQFYLSAPPGHRFTLYFPIWGWDKVRSAPTWAVDEMAVKKKRGSWVPEKVSNKTWACTVAAGKKPDEGPELRRYLTPRNDGGMKEWRDLLDSLIKRQAAFLAYANSAFVLEATATAPFTTGLGNEHPLENGFAFLNPYGLPYLPGSGVKGVLRQAAKELASGQWGDNKGWSEDKCYTLAVGKDRIPLSVIDVLFGLESPERSQQHVRGALSFWDVIPQIAGDSLMVEIMTTHQSHYYQQKKERKSGDSVSPHDSGQPNPICFLTVPPRSRFTFHVVCDEQHLRRLTKERATNAPDLLDDGDTHWKTLLESAFRHAFQWLGFGAKTAVGYGAMHAVESAASMPTSTQQRTPPASTSQPQLAAPSMQTTEEQWTNVTLTYQKGGGGVITVTGPAGKAEAQGAQAEAVRRTLSPEQIKRLEKKGSLMNLTVLVMIEGNLRTVKTVLPENSSV
ncbi:MAG: type III-B CRISPR module RAMP protein Cmr6 [Nitrospira sp.]|nr:type III-B CRISPR module RAMP protein Cmr6 [Nitrospira sp.]